MKYLNLGRSGLKVSRICVGCMSFGAPDPGGHRWLLGEDASRPLIQYALERGVNFFDCANSYSHGTVEEITGRALRDFAKRDEIVVATKCYFPWRNAPNTGGLSRKAIFQAIDDSLTRLGMDYVDLYQIHRFDYQTPLEETLEALDDVVKAGKARYLGASSMFAWQFARALYTADHKGWRRFISMQNHLNLIHREEEREMLPLCKSEGVGVLPWSPLARGKLARPWDAAPTQRSKVDGMVSARFYSGMEDNDRDVVGAVGAVATARGVPQAQVALAWVLQSPGVVAPVMGMTKTQHLDDAIAALDVVLTPEEIAHMEAPYRPHPVVGFE